MYFKNTKVIKRTSFCPSQWGIHGQNEVSFNTFSVFKVNLAHIGLTLQKTQHDGLTTEETEVGQTTTEGVSIAIPWTAFMGEATKGRKTPPRGILRVIPP